MRAGYGLIFSAALLWTGGGLAQQPPPPYPQPPPPYPQPPPPYPQPPYPQQPQPYYPQPYAPQPYPQPYGQPYPAPTQPQYQPEPEPRRLVAEYIITEPNYGLIVGGTLLFVASYGVPLIVAGANDFSNNSEWLAIPLFGNIVTMKKRSWNKDNGAIGLGLTLAGLYQHAGVAMLIVGATSTSTRTEKEWAWAPMLSSDVAGAQVAGRF